MSKNTKVTKYKIINTNINKKFIGKDLDLQRVKTKDDPNDGDRKPPKPRQAPTWFIEFRDEQREFNKFVHEDLNRVRGDLNRVREDLNRVIKLNNLRK